MTKNQKATMLDLLGTWAALANFYTRHYARKLAERYNQKVAVMVEVMEALGYEVDMEVTPQCEGLIIYDKITVDGRLVVESK